MDPKKYKQSLLDELYKNYKNSMPCHLGFAHRQNIVWGDGNPNAKLMLIGEAPGAEEDKQGKPFVGRSGQLLTRALSISGLERKDIYITNIIKCRPPNNRVPTPEEIALCTERFLNKQIKIIRPKIIATVGSVALNSLVAKNLKITSVHGKIIKKDDIIFVPIYHPAYVLRNKSVADEWLKDIKLIKTELEKLKLA